MQSYDPDAVATIIIDTAYRIHTDLGPGLLESAYQAILAQELGVQGLPVEREKRVHLSYRGHEYEDVYRADLIVASAVVVELKAQEHLPPVCTRQLFTYLKVLDKRIGLLINFGALHLKDGIKRVVYRYVPSAGNQLRVNRR